MANIHPTIFTQVVAHEFGHAQVALTDPALHVYAAFVDRHLPTVAAPLRIPAHCLPHEAAHDRFGVWVVAQEGALDELRGEIAARLNDPRERAPERLRLISAMSPSREYEHLRAELGRFCARWKVRLVARWNEQLKGPPASSLVVHAPIFRYSLMLPNRR
jgi:hypothetical protein